MQHTANQTHCSLLQVKSKLATFSLKMEDDLEVIQQAMERLEKYRP